MVERRLYTKLEDEVIKVLREKQVSVREIADRLDRSPSSVRQRITYLRSLHRIR